MIGAIRDAVAPIEQRVRMMVGRAIVSLVNDHAKAQELQIELLDDESQDGVERFQNYGVTAHPHPGAEALVVFAGGLRSHGIALAVEDRRYRMTALQQGEVAIHDDLGNVILLGRDSVKITAVSKIEVEAPEAVVTAGSVNLTANSVTVTSDDISLGAAGGAKVARVGDDVDPATNKIISGSDKVTAA